MGDGYTSFCSVNESINCDVVLASSYAKIAGVPVAWMALATYLLLAGLFALAARGRPGDDDRRALLVRLGGLGVLGSLVFSGYMAVVSVFRLETICLLCTGLYAVSLTNAALTFATLRAWTGAGRPSPLGWPLAASAMVAGVGGVVLLAQLTWPSPTGQLSSDIRTAADVRREEPEFAKWFEDLPRVEPSSLLPPGQKGELRPDHVLIVDFFDLECAHCRRNHALVQELVRRRADQVRIVHRHFPLDATCNDVVPMSIHRNACRAAEAVECAALQGRRDDMIDILFRNQSQLFFENLPRLGAKIGLDRDELLRCLEENETLPTVLADARAGAKLGIKSTPTVFLGHRRLHGTLEEVGQYEMAVLLESSGAATAPR